MRASDYRAKARNALRGKWWYMVGTLLTMNFIIGIIMQVLLGIIRPVLIRMQYNVGGVGMEAKVFVIAGLFGLMVALLQIVVTVGQYRIAGDVLDGGLPYVRRLFPMNQFGTILGMNLWRALKTLLWALPGIVLMAVDFAFFYGNVEVPPWAMEHGNSFVITLFIGEFLLLIPVVIATFRYIMADYLLADYPSMGAREAVRESAKRMKGYKWKYFCLNLSFIGWTFLAAAVEMAMSFLLMQVYSYVTSMIVSLASAIIQSMLSAYVVTASVAFFRDIPRAEERAWQEANRPEPEAEPQREAEAHVDYSAAMELFYLHQCSRRALNRAGRLGEYEAMGVPAKVEKEWIEKYATALLRRFEGDTAALGGLIELMSEYGMESVCDRTIGRIDRHLHEFNLSAKDILPLCGRMMALLRAGAFASNEAFAQAKMEKILKIVDQLEARLESENPAGDWRAEIERIRNM